MSDSNPGPGETDEFLADRHIDLDAGEFGGAMTDADFYDRTAGHSCANPFCEHPDCGADDPGPKIPAAAPAKMPACALCDDTGMVWTDGCNCGVGPHGYYGMHEPYCGAEPCGCGSPVNLPETAPGGTA